MPSSHLILCRPLLLLPSIFPSITVFSSESTLCIRWPKYWSFSFSSSPSHVSLITNALTGTSPTSQPLIHPWQRHFPPWEQCLDAHFYILASIKLLGGPQYSWTFQPSAFLIVTICFFFKFIWLHWVLVVMHGIFSLWHVTSSMWHVGPTCLPKDRTQIPGTGNTVLATGQPGKSLTICFIFYHLPSFIEKEDGKWVLLTIALSKTNKIYTHF